MKSSNKIVLDDKHFIRHKLFDKKKSLLQKYSELVIGHRSALRLFRYELITIFLADLPGAPGLFLRRFFYRPLFKEIGKNVVFGKGIVIRHPDNIVLGNRVVIDDYALIDARGAGQEGIIIGDYVIINRYVTIQAKAGGISIGSSSSIGARTSIVSQGGIIIEECVRMAGGCFVSGGIFDVTTNEDSSESWGRFTKGPIRIDKNCRIGMACVILDGVHIKKGVQLAPMSLVNKDLPDYCVAAGMPARPIYYRKHGE